MSTNGKHHHRHYTTLSPDQIRDAIMQALLQGQAGVAAISYRICKALNIDGHHLGAATGNYKNKFEEMLARRIEELQRGNFLYAVTDNSWALTPKALEPGQEAMALRRAIADGQARVYKVIPQSDRPLTDIGKTERLIVDIFLDIEQSAMLIEDLIREALAASPPGTQEPRIQHAIRALEYKGYLENPEKSVLVLTPKAYEEVEAHTIEFQCYPEHQAEFYNERCPPEKLTVAALYILACEEGRSLEDLVLQERIALLFNLDPAVHVRQHIYRLSEFSDRCDDLCRRLRKAGCISSPYGKGGKSYLRLEPIGWQQLAESTRTLKSLGKSLPSKPKSADPIDVKIVEKLTEETPSNIPQPQSSQTMPPVKASSLRCFWCETSLNETLDHGFYVIVDREIEDNNGAHMELAYFCLSCSQRVRDLLTSPCLNRIK